MRTVPNSCVGNIKKTHEKMQMLAAERNINPAAQIILECPDEALTSEVTALGLVGGADVVPMENGNIGVTLHFEDDGIPEVGNNPGLAREIRQEADAVAKPKGFSA